MELLENSYAEQGAPKARYGAPGVPATVADTGLDLSSIMRLTAKCAAEQDTVTPGYISDRIKLPKPIVNAAIKELTKLALVEARGLATEDDVRSDIRYALSTKGMDYAQAAARQSQYVGPAPVSLDAFCDQVVKQSIHQEHVTRARLAQSLTGLVLPESLLERLGPAFSSGRSILFYGPPGNGKTSIAERTAKLFDQTIFLPYAVDIGGHTMRFFDEAVHEPVAASGAPAAGRVDRRWVECRRPVIKTGGELTLELLDLIFDPISNFYEAPMHLKASGGVFIIDDFGRQQMPPQSLINRWIVPLERGYDFLTLHTGKKFKIPFDELVIFSTNIEPTELTDAAGLRRLKYKIHIENPTKPAYFDIFRAVCRSEGVRFSEAELALFYDRKYSESAPPACFHPAYLAEYVRAFCDYNEIERGISASLLETAWRDIFVDGSA